jgi:hypothetical protein
MKDVRKNGKVVRMRHGRGKMSYDDGSTFDGEWSENAKVNGTLIWTNGTRTTADDAEYEGEFSG